MRIFNWLFGFLAVVTAIELIGVVRHLYLIG